MQTFMTTINGMDWSNKDNWEELPETMKELGLEIPEEELDNFIASAIEAANAIDNINLENLTEELKGMAGLSKGMYTGE
jgi:hypothetical protein